MESATEAASDYQAYDYQTYFETMPSLQELPLVREAVHFMQALNKKMQAVVQETFAYLHSQLKRVPLDEWIARVNEMGTHVERAFNIAAVVPVLGTLTSAARMTCAKIQFLAGAILACTAEFVHLVASKSSVEKEFLVSMRILSALGLEFMIHGVLNYMRAAGELIVGTCTLGLGSIALIVPNIYNYRNFTPVFAYGTLLNEKGEKWQKSAL